ncbi:delta(24)-sterol reductase [Cymbomonas tetramitiformis]|uniref:Delta(24)-sterol reductase n=1 Tax=Cymbomonas tetramitiformis TaxID=36881 RepID=A0AAE0F5P4_9CHLO|nr:delta(24)-sterol reductase [Cymbomonas tetramitiformis]|eukprot:gene6436-7713_t
MKVPKILYPIIDVVATHLRPLAMMYVVLPLSFILRNVLAIHAFVYNTFLASPQLHQSRVDRVSACVKRRFELPPEKQKPMCTARAAWMNLSTRFATYKESSERIYVADLCDIISLDEKNMIVRAEPLVEVGTMTRWLQKRGYMLAVNLEIEEATLGGLAMAVGMSTYSHISGLYQENVVAYEVVLADGTFVRATRDNEYKDLWHALPWSHGSLALLVCLELKVIPTKPYVHVKYTPFHDQKKYCDYITEISLAKDPPDFVEASVFSEESAVVMEGRFVDITYDPLKWLQINHVGLWYKQWFWMHVKGFLSKSGPVNEYVPTLEYVFRHNRGIFWALRDQMGMIGNNVFFRYFFGWLSPPKVTFLKLPATPEIRVEMMCQRVYQDIVLPLRTLPEAINKASKLFGCWPILVYPSRVYDHGEGNRGIFPSPPKEDLVPGENYGMFYDLGVYGIPHAVRKKLPYKAVTNMREMEDYTSSVGGGPFLYADTFMSKEEFGKMFNLDLYDKVRVKYGAVGHFPELYDKIKPEIDYMAILDQENKTY